MRTISAMFGAVAVSAAASGSTTGTDLTGMAGWVADVIAALGSIGVGVLTAIENLFPPIPSEVVLPLAGYLASRGELNLIPAIVASTIGSLVGAIVLYETAAGIGKRRLRTVVGKVALVDDHDLDRAEDWFDHHGDAAVFFGRFIPGVRSLVSIPAGTQGMSRWRFWLYTTTGSATWNTAFVLAGYVLGRSWRSIGQYSDWINYAIIAALVAVVVRIVWKRRERIIA